MDARPRKVKPDAWEILDVEMKYNLAKKKMTAAPFFFEIVNIEKGIIYKYKSACQDYL